MHPIDIDIHDQQELYNLDVEQLRVCARFIMERVQSLDMHFHWMELSVLLTDDSIRALNREWIGNDCVTDVISFAYPTDELSPGDSGEVIINVQQAWEEGKLRESADQELALYLAHGCHHLMGADDQTPEEKEAMLTQEQDWVRQAQERGLLGPFFL